MAINTPIYQRPRDLQTVLKYIINTLPNSHTNLDYTSCFEPKTHKTVIIPLQNYVERIFLHMGCSSSCFIIALILLERIQRSAPDFTITEVNIYKLFFTSVLIATKAYDDVYCENKYYSIVGGISVQELKKMEMKFVSLLDFHCLVSDEEFQQFVKKLEKIQESKNPDSIQRREGYAKRRKTKFIKKKSSHLKKAAIVESDINQS